ncbi:Putative diacyglycerol O-acyltransferase [Zhongshania aliphaticivorans]|uniref:diacylglycerol O-acyltransferase n=1 Tax=Zhongshania aliphaticivorans TaxID=1470434 RepID=A0A5S9QAF1_9GAMM|nr:wax ester/triacylglycerol synthase family O-acyltransferase [Zhongshania aliphaticivorans]CAA0087546.1 Putative diacyglycerol O-acyltransferase [Zhongshania aliphaticivorans]CAA0115078.1 Putative diacyglycerol O-acyltransferase [Zhongshania aliphaticivorans]CAA0119918.1 Putative diacyglycerol O-acyltransferase [Zhongshania aliphaticivorans]
MKQLGVLDSAFINLEHPNTPQHVGGLGIYDPSTAPGGFVRFKGVIANFERRLSKHTIFRSRLLKVPGNLDRPYWVEDANFDVEFHIRHIALPQPGDWRQLCILVARLHARPLDMNRPLWEAYIIEGLDNIPGVPKGGFAIYTKMHHSLVDGAGGSSIMSVIHDLEPDPSAVPQGPSVVSVDVSPGAMYLATASALNNVKNGVRMLTGGAGVLRDLGKMAIGMAQKKIPLPSIASPRTRFNTPVGPYRVFEAAEFPLNDVKFLKDFAGVKINDVVLCIVAGGLRHYLRHHDELPDQSLSVSIPLDMRTRRGMTNENNQIGSVFVDLHTNIHDPLDRLKAIYRSSQEAKVYGENSPLVDVLKLAGVMSPAITRPLVNSYSNNQWTRHLPLGISSVVSNVAGPNFPLYSAGAQMVRYYGLGLLTPGVGLFHLIFSSNGIMTMSILGDRDAMPDPAFYRECIEKAFSELLAAVKPDENTEKVPTTKANTVKTVKKREVKPALNKVDEGGVSSPRRRVKPRGVTPTKKPVARKAKSKTTATAAGKSKDLGTIAERKVVNMSTKAISENAKSQ